MLTDFPWTLQIKGVVSGDFPTAEVTGKSGLSCVLEAHQLYMGVPMMPLRFEDFRRFLTELQETLIFTALQY